MGCMPCQKQELERKIVASDKQQPRLFWSYVQSKTRTKSGICDLTYFEDNIKLSATTDKRKAEVLASFFSSVFTNEPSSDETPSIPYVETTSICDKIFFNHNVANNKLSNLLPFISPGPDINHPFVSKSLCDIVCKPLAIILKTSLDTMSLPNIWKTANVSSIFKNGDRSDPSNHRPISLTCVASKTMESIIKDVIITYLLENNLLSNCQFGFVSDRSVQLQLLSLLSHWTDILDSCHTIDVIYLDFKKAFDSVPHIHLLSKLHSYGFS